MTPARGALWIFYEGHAIYGFYFTQVAAHLIVDIRSAAAAVRINRTLEVNWTRSVRQRGKFRRREPCVLRIVGLRKRDNGFHHIEWLRGAR